MYPNSDMCAWLSLIYTVYKLVRVVLTTCEQKSIIWVLFINMRIYPSSYILHIVPTNYVLQLYSNRY